MIRMRFLLLTGLFLSFILATYFVFVIFKYPYIGIIVKKADHQIVVDSVDPYGWASEQSIYRGDVIRLIDGRSPTKKPSVQHKEIISDAKKITIERGNQDVQYKIDNHQPVTGMIYYFLVPSVFFLVCFSLGCFLFKFLDKNKSIPVLILFLAVIAPVLLNISANSRIYNWSRYTVGIFMCISLVLLLHFLRNYYHSSSRLVSNHVLSFLYLGAGLVLINRVIAADYPLELFFVPVVFIILMISVFRLYYQTKNSEVKKSLQVLFTGIFLALMPFVTLYALPIVIFKDSIMPWEWTTPFLVFLPITTGYLVLTYKMIDLSFIINRLHYYCLMSLMIMSVILTGTLAFDPGKLSGNIFRITRLALFVFTVILLFLYIKDYVEYRFRKIMFPKRQDFQMSLNRFLQWMKSEHKLANLAFILKREIENFLPAKEVTLVKVDQNGKAISLLDNTKVNVTHHSMTNECTERLQMDVHGFKINLYHDKSGTIFLYGRWKMRRKLNPDEKIWLETLLNYAQVVIENQDKAEDLIALLSLEKDRDLLPHTVKKAIFNISERERKQLSRDLHDTIIQELLALARDVDIKRAGCADPFVIDMLSEIREEILNNIKTLREIIHHLHPEFIHKMGLPLALNQLCLQVQKQSSFALHMHIDQHFTIFDRELEINMYRIVQELLNNAIKHSQAEHVSLILAEESTRYILLYDDDGIGIDKDVLKRQHHFSTMGWPGLNGRVAITGGQLNIDSLKTGNGRKGLHLEIVWPISRGL